MHREGEGFFHFAVRLSQQHQAYFGSLDLDPERRAIFIRLPEESLARQKTLEVGNDESFADYLQRYFGQPV